MNSVTDGEVDILLRSRLPRPSPVRRKWSLPNGAKLAVWTIVNVEAWSATRSMPRTILPPPMGKLMLPDIANWSWHEYGMRSGFWRFVEVLRHRNLKATLAINGAACRAYPEACEAALKAGWEFMGHGFNQLPMHEVVDQRSAMESTRDEIKRVTGRYPRGWESPGLTQTLDTAEYLVAAKYEYVADWVVDDQPVDLKLESGRLTSVPYSVEINDVVLSAVQQHRSDEILLRGKDHFDRLYQEATVDAPLVTAIAIHPYLTGVPHRIGYLERLYDYILSKPGVVICMGEEILDWYRA